MIVASRNELGCLLKYALQGVRHTGFDYESSAELLLWAAMHGCLKWQTFAKTLDRIESGPAKIEFNIDSSSVDLKGQSLVIAGSRIADLAIAHALENASFQCRIDACHDAEFMGAKLVEASRHGLWGLLIWRADGAIECFEVDEYSSFPAHSIAEPTDGVDAHSAELFLSQTKNDCAQFLVQHWPTIAANKRSKRTKIECHDFECVAIEQGLPVPQEIWQRLTEMASRILVPNSEQSRKGAGE